MKLKYQSTNYCNMKYIVIMIFALGIAIFGYSKIGFAQEESVLLLSIDGYNESSILNAKILDSNSNMLYNKSSNSPLFEFENLILGEEYSVLLNYKGIEYVKTIILNNSLQEYIIQVYEPTNSDAKLIVNLHQVFIDHGNSYLNITEFIVYQNIGDNVINGSDIKIGVPRGFRNFIWDQDCCFQASDFGFFFKPIEPIFPNGTKSINFKYRLDPESSEYSHINRFFYDTDNVLIRLDTGLQVISTENLWNQGTFPDNGGDVEVYGAASFFAGELVSITISGYESAGQLNILWIGIGVMAILVAVGVFYGFRKSKVSITRLKSEEEALLTVSKQLKKDFNSKKISEVEYLKLQLKYKKKLEQVRKRIKEYKNR